MCVRLVCIARVEINGFILVEVKRRRFIPVQNKASAHFKSKFALFCYECLLIYICCISFSFLTQQDSRNMFERKREKKKKSIDTIHIKEMQMCFAMNVCTADGI